jgi:GxxExxY protein
VSFQRSPLAETVIGLAIEVHRTLGPGLIESVYARCLGLELATAGLCYEAEVRIPVRYKGRVFGYGYRADLIVERVLLVEVKSVNCVLPIHTAQTLTYLKVSGLRQALLFNFNERRLVDGLRSIVN